MRRSAKVDARKVKGIEKRERCYELRVEGKTERAIAAELGCSRTLVRKYIAEAYEVTLKPLQEELKSIALSRVERLIATFMPKAEKGDEKAAMVVLRAEQRRSKLLGLDHRDAPPVIPPPVTVSTSWDFSTCTEAQKVALREIMLHVKQRTEIVVQQPPPVDREP